MQVDYLEFGLFGVHCSSWLLRLSTMLVAKLRINLCILGIHFLHPHHPLNPCYSIGKGELSS